MRGLSLWILGGLLATVPAGWAESVAAPRPGEGWPLWKAYAASTIDPEGRVVDHQAGDRTTSEGQSYGMFFALIANDRQSFDRLLHWTAYHLAGGNLGSRLPGWLWGKDAAGHWTLLDAHSAADADLWIAYTLCEAGRLWHEPGYIETGHSLLLLIAAEEVADLPGFGTMLMPGNSGFHPADTWIINPSYLPLPLLTRLGDFDPGGPWQKIAVRLPALLQKGARRGFAMDWLSYRVQEGFQPAPLPGDPAPAGGSYDAVRVYLWAGLTHPQTAGASEVLSAVPGMADYLATHPIPPEHVDAAGDIAGSDAPVGFSAALLPYLRALGAKNALATQAQRVGAHLDPATGLCCLPATYYDQNLALFGLGSSHHLFAFRANGELQLPW